MTSKEAEKTLILAGRPHGKAGCPGERAWQSRHRGIMRNLCCRVITMAMGLYFTGTVTNPSRNGSVFFNSECQWNGYLLTNCSFPGKHDIPEDISQTAAWVDVSPNVSRGLLQSPVKKEESLKHLDLSNNRISKVTLRPLARLRGLETLNLSNSGVRSFSLDLPGPRASRGHGRRSSLTKGLPRLKLLILQRNELSDIPKGLWKLRSLQSLDLSFNGISQVSVSDFHGCLRLEHLNLRSNKIFRIHPEAFKDLRKLQALDLRKNALSAALPVLALALRLPRLEARLADNPWRCDGSLAVLRSLAAASWRGNWDVLCNKSLGNEEARWWTPQSRLSRETRLPHADLSDVKSLSRSTAARPRDETDARLPTLGSKDPAGSHPDPTGSHPDPGQQQQQQERPPRRVRSPPDGHRAGREDAVAQDPALVICLAVFITFLVAFVLGAWARPHMDRLWQQRCRKRRGPGSDSAYFNRGFRDDVEAAGTSQHPGADLHRARHGLDLRESQGALPGAKASPQAAVTADRTLAVSRKLPGSGQGWAPRADDTGAPRGKDNVLPRINILGEISDDLEAPEGSLRAYPVGVPGIASRSPTGSGSIQKDSDELDRPTAREGTAALYHMQPHREAQATGEKEEREATGRFPSELSKEMRGSTSVSLLNAQQQWLKGGDADGDRPPCCGSATLGDLAPPAFPPAGGSALQVTPANQDPAPRHTPSDAQYELDSNYESDDSDEGSLFTLSSTSAEDARNVSGEEADSEESPRTSAPPEDQDSGLKQDSVLTLESLEDSIPSEKIPGKCDNHEDHFEKPLVFGWHESYLESASNTKQCDTPLPSPESGDSSPPGDQAAGRVPRGWAPPPQPEAADWHRSLRDLDVFSVEVTPPPLSPSADGPLDPRKTACRKRDSAVCKCEQDTDIDKNGVPFQTPSWEDFRPSQQGSEGGSGRSGPMDTGTSEGGGRPLGDCGSRGGTGQTRRARPCRDTAALQREGGGGEYLEEASQSPVTLSQEPSGDRERGPGSEEGPLQVGEGDSDSCPQGQARGEPD